ncbi:hypothetical protein D3C76_1468600 [compost metagenome]
MADLHGVAQTRIAANGGACVALQAFVCLFGAGPGGLAVLGQLVEEVTEALGVEFQCRGKLPKEGAQLVAQQQRA